MNGLRIKETTIISKLKIIAYSLVIGLLLACHPPAPSKSYLVYSLTDTQLETARSQLESEEVRLLGDYMVRNFSNQANLKNITVGEAIEQQAKFEQAKSKPF